MFVNLGAAAAENSHLGNTWLLLLRRPHLGGRSTPRKYLMFTKLFRNVLIDKNISVRRRLCATNLRRFIFRKGRELLNM